MRNPSDMEVLHLTVKDSEGFEYHVEAGGLAETEVVTTYRYSYELLQFASDDPEDTFVWELTYNIQETMGEFYLYEADIQVTDAEHYTGWEDALAKIAEELKSICDERGVIFVPKPADTEPTSKEFAHSLDHWSKLAGEALQEYCEETRGQDTDTRNRGRLMQKLAAWLYWNILPQISFEDAYDACCRSVDEVQEECPKMWQAAKNAIDVQDACNLTGVMYSFLRELAFLADEVQAGRIPRPLKNHYVIRLYADKICDLAGVKTDAAASEVLPE